MPHRRLGVVPTAVLLLSLLVTPILADEGPQNIHGQQHFLLSLPCEVKYDMGEAPATHLGYAPVIFTCVEGSESFLNVAFVNADGTLRGHYRFAQGFDNIVSADATWINDHTGNTWLIGFSYGQFPNWSVATLYMNGNGEFWNFRVIEESLYSENEPTVKLGSSWAGVLLTTYSYERLNTTTSRYRILAAWEADAGNITSLGFITEFQDGFYLADLKPVGLSDGTLLLLTLKVNETNESDGWLTGYKLEPGANPRAGIEFIMRTRGGMKLDASDLGNRLAVGYTYQHQGTCWLHGEIFDPMDWGTYFGAVTAGGVNCNRPWVTATNIGTTFGAFTFDAEDGIRGLFVRPDMKRVVPFYPSINAGDRHNKSWGIYLGGNSGKIITLMRYAQGGEWSLWSNTEDMPNPALPAHQVDLPLIIVSNSTATK